MIGSVPSLLTKVVQLLQARHRYLSSVLAQAGEKTDRQPCVLHLYAKVPDVHVESSEAVCLQASMGPALQKAKWELDAQNKPGVVCVTGSLHAAAEALRLTGLA